MSIGRYNNPPRAPARQSRKLGTGPKRKTRGKPNATSAHVCKAVVNNTYHETVVAYVSGDFNTSTKMRMWREFKEKVAVPGKNAFVTVVYSQQRKFKEMNLSEKAERIRTTPNAGGSSIESEVLSYELLHRCFGATLLKTETEITYFPEGGSITDYTCKILDNTLGVSVTRAWKYRGEFEQEDAEKLLKRKLKGIIYATRNSLDRWNKQVLHIWTGSTKTAELLRQEYRKLSQDLVSDTVVLITVVDTPATLFS